MKVRGIAKYKQLYYTETYLFEVVGRNAKKRGHLTFEEFYRICMWKSSRQKQRYLKNKKRVKAVTRRAFTETNERLKMEILCELSGVGIPTASAILTMVYPRRYAIIDIRCIEALREIFGQDQIKETITMCGWLRYLELMREWAKENGVMPRELDMVLFAMHKEMLDEESNRNLYGR